MVHGAWRIALTALVEVRLAKYEAGGSVPNGRADAIRPYVTLGGGWWVCWQTEKKGASLCAPTNS